MNRFEFYSNIGLFNEKNYLQHHGIKGQKWGVRRYQNPDGSLTEEGKARYLNPDGSLNDKAPNKIRNAYNQYQYKKTQNEKASGELYEDNHVYNKDVQAEKMNHAKTSRNFDVNFLEATQNADDMTDKERETEYAKYLKNPYKYMEEFDSNNWRKSQTKMGSTKSESSKDNSSEYKKELNKRLDKKGYIDVDDLNEMKNLSTKKPDKSSKDNSSEYKKELNKRLDKKGYVDVDDLNEMKNLSTKKPDKSQFTKGSSKPSKEEKKAIKEAKKETTKLLKGGSMVGNWDTLNKAMDDLGYTSAERKNLSSSDWDKINKQILKYKQ